MFTSLPPQSADIIMITLVEGLEAMRSIRRVVKIQR
jgi:hypothetical protein